MKPAWGIAQAAWTIYAYIGAIWAILAALELSTNAALQAAWAMQMFNLTSAVFAPKAIFKLRKWHKQIQFSQSPATQDLQLAQCVSSCRGWSIHGSWVVWREVQPNGVPLAAKENTWRKILVFPIQIRSESISFRPLRLQTRPSVWACDPLTQAQLCLLGLGARQVPPWDSQSLFDHVETVSSHLAVVKSTWPCQVTQHCPRVAKVGNHLRLDAENAAFEAENERTIDGWSKEKWWRIHG